MAPHLTIKQINNSTPTTSQLTCYGFYFLMLFYKSAPTLQSLCLIGPTSTFSTSINTHLLHLLLPFSPPFLSSPSCSLIHSCLISSCLAISIMFLGEEAAAQFQLPVLETGFTADDIQEWLSDLFQSNSGSSEGSTRAVYSDDERKKRRMISNRESARRSRWRKKKQLEDLTEELNRSAVENQVLKNELNIVLNQCYLLWRENEQLTSEYVALRTRLSNLYRILGSMQTPSQ